MLSAIPGLGSSDTQTLPSLHIFITPSMFFVHFKSPLMGDTRYAPGHLNNAIKHVCSGLHG